MNTGRVPSLTGHPMRGLAMIFALFPAACGSGSELVSPTPDMEARDLYANIVAGANAILFTDELGYYGTSDTPWRSATRCREDLCRFGLSRSIVPSRASIEDVDLVLHGPYNDVELVEEQYEGDTSAVTVYGGWMEHSFFASQANLYTAPDDPNQGLTVAFGYAIGHSTGKVPNILDGAASWSGFMVGRDISRSETRGHIVLGDATVTVYLGETGIAADVEFSDLAERETGAPRPGMTWTGMAVEKGQFGRSVAADDAISGRFFGPHEQEVGGVFERDRLAGAFGGKRY